MTIEEMKTELAKRLKPSRYEHSLGVARAAVKLAEALNDHGHRFDIDLIRGAALIHDIARVHDEHWIVGADIADKLGYHDEADIIRVHHL